MQQGTEDKFWLTLITLQNELKLSHYLILGTWMQRGLYEKILLLDLEFLTPSFQITGFNLLVKFLGGIAVN